MAETDQRRWGNWAEQRAQRLLLAAGWRVVARQWRCRCGADGWGVAALDRRKWRRLEATFGLWLAQNPCHRHSSLELVCALVPLPPARGPVRWVRWG